jgi:hypothetical protein
MHLPALICVFDRFRLQFRVKWAEELVWVDVFTGLTEQYPERSAVAAGPFVRIVKVERGVEPNSDRQFRRMRFVSKSVVCEPQTGLLIL